MKAAPSLEFARLVVLHNPRSSNAARVAGIAAALEKSYPSKVVQKSIGKTVSDNTKLLQRTLKRGDILVVCGGDGTIGTIIECLLDPKIPENLRQTPVLPVGTGRMNDLARIANGRHAANPLYVLRHGRPTAVYPLRCVCSPLKPGDKSLTKTAVYSVGFGYSGEGSVILNDPQYRAKPQLRTPITRPIQFIKDGWDLLRQAKHFNITLNGKKQAVLDISAGNGHILYGYLQIPVKLSQRQFYLSTMDDKSPAGAATLIADMATKRSGKGQTLSSASFTLHDPVTGHVGGEVFTPPTPCTVTITHHEQPVTMLITSPKA